MLRLILMRHAKSDWSAMGRSDHDRPLNKRGRAAAAALGDWLRAKNCLPHEVLCSSAKRTGETLLGLRLTDDTPVRFSRPLYHAEAPAMLEVLREAQHPSVLMLGHNPGICEMAHRMVEDPPAHERFDDYPTGATLICDFDAKTWEEVDWYTGRVIDFIVPRELTE